MVRVMCHGCEAESEGSAKRALSGKSPESLISWWETAACRWSHSDQCGAVTGDDRAGGVDGRVL